ncbi:ROK family protein [Dactylosporangium fulvum]|uniref:ROK family protein n=1 Tax=Dactylosporangium fulvum TaxID=53359 RepID=A0ABY5W713_9ACTN|nr:ROK family protein [Dactylosporangium fulvum]UWP85116.1 ROK family protein [Dactylosporangium fulvum]
MSAEPAAGRHTTSLPEVSTVTTLRQRNRALVLKHVILAQQTTRAAIARDSGLSTASAANLVADLINDGLVEERGSVSSKGGRPIALIGPRAESAVTIGADIGERGVAVEMFDLAMNRIDREFRGGAEEESPEKIGVDLQDALEALRDRNAARWPTLLGIGLGLPGLVEVGADGRQMLYAQSLGWPPVPVASLCDVGTPVLAENGAKMQTRAELWFGNARGASHALVALLGRGVGIGVVTDGRLMQGSHSSAGEWGHTVVERGGRVCRCGNRGCVEAYVGADAILDAWRRTGATFEGTGWRAIGELITAAGAGDPAASAIVDDVVDCLGAALGGMVNLTGPERIVIGGWVGLRLMESLSDRIGASIRRHSLARPAGQFRLLGAAFGGDAVATGSALLPLEAMIAADPAAPRPRG